MKNLSPKRAGSAVVEWLEPWLPILKTTVDWFTVWISEFVLLGLSMLIGMAFLAVISEMTKEQLRLLLYDHWFEFFSLILIITLIKSLVSRFIIVPYMSCGKAQMGD